MSRDELAAEEARRQGGRSADPPRAGRPVSSDLFRLLAETVADYAIFALDPGGHILTWNAGAQRIKGYAPEEIIGRHFSIFYPPPDVRRGKPDYALRVAADEGQYAEEGWRIRKDGSRFWANVLITALRDPAGELVGFAKVTRDLTERKQAEDALTQLLALERTAREQAEMAVERLRAVQAVTEAALAHLDLDELLGTLLDRIGDLLAVDTAAILLLEGDELAARAARGLEEEVERGLRVPLGRGFAGRVAAEQRPIVLDDLEHADVLNPLLREKGIRTLLGVPLLIEGRVIGVLHVGTLRDRRFTDGDLDLLQIVADRAALAIDHARAVEAERAARSEAQAVARALQLRDEFLSVASHELKTPITGLLGSTQLMIRRMDQGSLPDPNGLQRGLRTIESQARRLARLVAQLLDVSRIQTDRLELERQETDLAELVQRSVDALQPLAEDVRLQVNASQPVRAQVDSLRLEQVLANLLDNAIRYSPRGGEVEVDVGHADGDTVRLAVRDYGLGIPPERRQALFTRFYQAHAEDHRSGMGLGLYISRRIVQQHGGELVAEFPEDGGTRFVVTLPSHAPPVA